MSKVTAKTTKTFTVELDELESANLRGLLIDAIDFTDELWAEDLYNNLSHAAGDDGPDEPTFSGPYLTREAQG